MKICLDIQSAIGPGAGVGRYTRSLAAHLPAQAGPADALTCFYFDFRRLGAPPLLQLAAVKVPFANVGQVPVLAVKRSV